MQELSEISDLIIGTVLIPVLLLVFKNLLGDEIAYWITLLRCYMYRPFDLDGDPATHDWAMLYNEGDGSWELCSLTFHFGIDKTKNGVNIHRYRDGKIFFVQRMSFDLWRKLPKGRLDPAFKPETSHNPSCRTSVILTTTMADHGRPSQHQHQDGEPDRMYL